MASMIDAATTAASAPTRAREPHYLRTAVALSATAYLGFWFTYFGPNLRGTYPTAAPAVHLHGWSFFAFYLLLPLQAGLIHARRVRLHRTLGWSSLALAAVMTATGTLVLGVQMATALASPEPGFWSAWGLMIFATLVLFIGFYIAAIVLHRDRASHKRLMLVAGLATSATAADPSPAPPSTEATVSYVALGDSYASGWYCASPCVPFATLYAELHRIA